MSARGVALLAAAAACFAGAAARADEPRPAPGAKAVFALIVGVNASPEPDVQPLKYADDDAARYLDLFRALGARTYLLSRLDDNTRRLHPQAAAEAQPAGRADLRRAVEALGRDVAQARARGVRSVLYVIYAGHGNVEHDAAYLTLDDGRLDGASLLRDVVTPPRADESHVIVDACQAYLLAFERGPGGARRPVQGFVELEAAARQGRVGYVLSTSSTGEAHEWAGFEAGVFSHEVRSGLYGAADADGDGLVRYDELAAFVTRANANIVADRFRPQIVARPPAGGAALLDLRARAERELRLEGSEAASHYLLEDAQGVRLLDFHGTAMTPVRLVRPTAAGPLYLRRVADGAERTIPPSDGPVPMNRLPVAQPRAGVRGAAHHAFSSIFALPFDEQTVVTYDADTRARQRDEGAQETSRKRGLRVAGKWTLGAAALVGATAVGLELGAFALRGRPAPSSQVALENRNQQIGSLNQWAAGLLIGAAAAATAGTILFISGREGRESPVTVGVSPGSVSLAATMRF